VIFEYTLSPFLRTYQRSSHVYFIRAGQTCAWHAFGFGLLSVLAGLWCLPYGPGSVLEAVMINARGGTDVTEELLSMLGEASHEQPSPAGQGASAGYGNVMSGTAVAATRG